MERIRKLLLRLLLPLFKDYSYVIRNGIAKGLKRKGGLSFIPKFSSLDKSEFFLTKLSLKGKTVYDVGAHIGLFTIFFARAVGKRGKVVAFEPNPENYAQLLDNVAVNDFTNVIRRQLALGDKKGNIELAFVPIESSKSSMIPELKRKIVQSKNAKTFSAKLDTLDNQIKDLPKPDFIKIDVEGAELLVLRGAEQTISQHNPQIFIEIHSLDEELGRNTARKVLKLLDNHGYIVQSIYSGRMVSASASDEELLQCGAVYCQKATN